MIEAFYFKNLLDFVFAAHQENARLEAVTTRQNGAVPFVAHPFWCAFMLLNDCTFDQEERELGFQVLLCHDVDEDTMLPLPNFVDPRVPPLVQDMTYSSWEEEKREVPQKSIFIQMLKLIDKAASIYDHGVGKKRRVEWKAFAELLLRNTHSRYGHTCVYQHMRKIVVDWRVT